MIPKVIHYCWFGKNPKSQLMKKCLQSWEKYCPDYQIIEWNESNYDIDSAPLYVKQAYKVKKWAFVTDYIRLDVIYSNGGIYLDTDVELVNDFEDVICEHAFFGFEDTDVINTGLGFGAEKKYPLLYELMEDYKNIPFILDNNNYDLTPCPKRNTKVFLRHGLKTNGHTQILDDGTKILSKTYLCPLDNATRILKKTKHTLSIHHFDASWQSMEQRQAHDRLAKYRRMKLRIDQIVYFPRWFMRKVIGNKQYEKIKKRIKH